jgi:hypothetical protein
MSVRGDLLVKMLVHETSNQVANDLLKEFQLGYPIDSLRSLLESDDDAVVKNATWIASELGSKAMPILDSIPAVLRHNSKYVRFFAIDVVLSCAGARDGDLVATVITMLNDRDDAVRWKSLCFLAKASIGQILSCLDEFDDDDFRVLVKWFIDIENNAKNATLSISEKLCSQNGLERKFAAAAAARVSNVFPELLELTLGSSDEEISSFASDFVKP